MGNDIEGNTRGLIAVKYRNVPRETKENHETSVMIVVPAEIRTEHFPNINIVLYCCIIGYIGPERLKVKNLH
jgi:hypothetical protein